VIILSYIEIELTDLSIRFVYKDLPLLLRYWTVEVSALDGGRTVCTRIWLARLTVQLGSCGITLLQRAARFLCFQPLVLAATNNQEAQMACSPDGAARVVWNYSTCGLMSPRPPDARSRRRERMYCSSPWQPRRRPEDEAYRELYLRLFQSFRGFTDGCRETRIDPRLAYSSSQVRDSPQGFLTFH
jgi:hypothetical protein